MPIDRTEFNLLVDDSGSNNDGSPWNKAAIQDVLLDPIDAAIAPLSSVLPALCNARLTLTSGTPVTTTDASNNSLFVTPFRGNKVALYTGTAWQEHALTEINFSMAALLANTNYDIFLYSNVGTLTVDAVAWSSATARATALTTQDGVYVKTGATGRRYLGTIRTTTAGNSTDSDTQRFVWNYYNRVPRRLKRYEATSGWSYTTAAYRQANAAAANQVDMVIGVAEAFMTLDVHVLSRNTNADVSRHISIGEDSTTAAHGDVRMSLSAPITALDFATAIAALYKFPAVGYHYYAWLEFSAATGTTSWFGNGTGWRSGMLGSIEG